MLVYDHIDRSANTKRLASQYIASVHCWVGSLKVRFLFKLNQHVWKEWSPSSSNIARNQLYTILLHPTTCKTRFVFVFGSVDNRLLGYTWKQLIVLAVQFCSPTRTPKNHSLSFTIPNYYLSQEGEPLFEQLEFNTSDSSLPFNQ